MVQTVASVRKRTIRVNPYGKARLSRASWFPWRPIAWRTRHGNLWLAGFIGARADEYPGTAALDLRAVPVGIGCVASWPSWWGKRPAHNAAARGVNLRGLRRRKRSLISSRAARSRTGIPPSENKRPTHCLHLDCQPRCPLRRRALCDRSRALSEGTDLRGLPPHAHIAQVDRGFDVAISASGLVIGMRARKLAFFGHALKGLTVRLDPVLELAVVGWEKAHDLVLLSDRRHAKSRRGKIDKLPNFELVGCHVSLRRSCVQAPYGMNEPGERSGPPN